MAQRSRVVRYTASRRGYGRLGEGVRRCRTGRISSQRIAQNREAAERFDRVRRRIEDEIGARDLFLSYRRPALLIIASAIVLCALTACGRSGVVGKWRLSGGSDATMWEFSDNGAVRVGDIRGRYKFGDQDRIKIETPYATAVYQLKI